MIESADEARPDGRPMTRRRALYVVLGGAAASVAAALAGCSSDDSSDESGASDGAGRLASNGNRDSQGESVVVYASPSCGCCGQYADYLESEGGYTVDLQRTDDVDSIKADAGVPENAAGCHTTMLGDYVVEGHVPLEAVDKLLRERPAIDGIALPGMPAGSPGMGGTKQEPFEILSFADGTIETYTTI
jgi:hypothetical protein